jgi:hypothetical protein
MQLPDSTVGGSLPGLHAQMLAPPRTQSTPAVIHQQHVVAGSSAHWTATSPLPVGHRKCSRCKEEVDAGPHILAAMFVRQLISKPAQKIKRPRIAQDLQLQQVYSTVPCPHSAPPILTCWAALGSASASAERTVAVTVAEMRRWVSASLEARSRDRTVVAAWTCRGGGGGGGWSCSNTRPSQTTADNA